MSNINSVVITGNLTRDPEKKANGPAKLRVAVNERVKSDEQWTERANYFDVVVWGGQGDACLQWLSRGSPVAVAGHLRWHEYLKTDHSKVQAVEIVADTVQFIGGKGAEHEQEARAATRGPVNDDDDIPF